MSDPEFRSRFLEANITIHTDASYEDATIILVILRRNILYKLDVKPWNFSFDDEDELVEWFLEKYHDIRRELENIGFTVQDPAERTG